MFEKIKRDGRHVNYLGIEIFRGTMLALREKCNIKRRLASTNGQSGNMQV
jgi:hypothetical protein